MPSGAFAVLGPKVMMLVGFTKSNFAPIVGTTSLAIGLVEATTEGLAGYLGPLNIAAGGVVMVLFFFGKGLLRIAERWLDSQGEKLIKLPTAEQLSEDKKSLFETLERLGTAADAERRTMASFRETLAGTLADHSARIKSLEDKVS